MTAIADAPAATGAWTGQTITLCQAELSLVQAGHGEPLLLLPRDNGHPPRRQFASLLAAGRRVTYPHHPGFAGTPNPADWEWLVNVRDLAVVELQLVRALGLDRPVLVGLGFGGWVAAEMATMAAGAFSALVLVAPMGIKPTDGFIYDQFLVGTESYARMAFTEQAAFEAEYGAEPAFEQLDAWETDRAMTSRLAWKPYMYNTALPRLLRGVDIPALVIAGDADRIVPLECARRYAEALPNATLETMPGCGHAIDIEYPDALAAAINAFLARTPHR